MGHQVVLAGVVAVGVDVVVAAAVITSLWAIRLVFGRAVPPAQVEQLAVEEAGAVAVAAAEAVVVEEAEEGVVHNSHPGLIPNPIRHQVQRRFLPATAVLRPILLVADCVPQQILSRQGPATHRVIAIAIVAVRVERVVCSRLSLPFFASGGRATLRRWPVQTSAGFSRTW